jgi:PEP-CTERM motif-containing protein
MKKLITTALAAIAGAGLISQPSNAATTAYNEGDLMLGFRQVGASNDYIIDLGPASTYRDATSSFTLTINGNSGGGFGLDLTSIFGSGWKTDPNVFWGIVGTPGAATVNSDPANTLYGSKPESPFGTQATAYTRDTASTQGGVRSDIDTMGGAFGGHTSSTNSSIALIQSATASNSWASFNPGGQSFSYFTGMEGNFASGTAQTALDIFRMSPTTSSNLPGSYEGTFTINDSGVLKYNASVVPEPSTFAAFGVGMALLAIMARRRRRAVTA